MISPTIPDNTYKFLLYIGIIIIGFAYFQDKEATDEYNNVVDISNSYVDSIAIKVMDREHERQLLLDIANDLSTKYSVTNPITSNDTITYFAQRMHGTKEELLVSDTLREIWKKYANKGFEIKVLDKKSDMKIRDLEDTGENLTLERITYVVLVIFGSILSVIGYIGLQRYQKMQQQLVEIDIHQKDTKFRSCQSCGRNFSSIIKHGKELDGNENPAFCIDCYENGEFKEPDLTWNQFRERIESTIASKKYSFERAKLLEKFQKLDRWNNDLYD